MSAPRMDCHGDGTSWMAHLSTLLLGTHAFVTNSSWLTIEQDAIQRDWNKHRWLENDLPINHFCWWQQLLNRTPSCSWRNGSGFDLCQVNGAMKPQTGIWPCCYCPFSCSGGMAHLTCTLLSDSLVPASFPSLHLGGRRQVFTKLTGSESLRQRIHHSQFSRLLNSWCTSMPHGSLHCFVLNSPGQKWMVFIPFSFPSPSRHVLLSSSFSGSKMLVVTSKTDKRIGKSRQPRGNNSQREDALPESNAGRNLIWVSESLSEGACYFHHHSWVSSDDQLPDLDTTSVMVPSRSPPTDLKTNPNLCPVLPLNKGPPSLDSFPQTQLHRTDNSLYEDTEHYGRKEKH